MDHQHHLCININITLQKIALFNLDCFAISAYITASKTFTHVQLKSSELWQRAGAGKNLVDQTRCQKGYNSKL